MRQRAVEPSAETTITLSKTEGWRAAKTDVTINLSKMAAATEAPPAGVVPIFLRPTTAERLGLKTGPRVLDVAPFARVQKSELVAEIAKLGVMSDFSDHKVAIQQCEMEDILIVSDTSQKWGEIFALVVTREAKAAMEDDLARREQERLDPGKAAREAEELAQRRREEEEEREMQLLVFDPSPRLARPWASASAELSAAEVTVAASQQLHTDAPVGPATALLASPAASLVTMAPCRPLVRFEVTLQRSGEARLTPFIAMASPVIELRSAKEKLIPPMECDVGVQAAPLLRDACIQVGKRRAATQVTQTEAPAQPPFVSEERLEAFFARVMPVLEDALTENEAIDLFANTQELAAAHYQMERFENALEIAARSAVLGIGLDVAMGEVEPRLATWGERSFLQAGAGGVASRGIGAVVAAEASSRTGSHVEVRELKNFAHPAFTKNQPLVGIEWVPRGITSLDLVAVAVGQDLAFSSRLQLAAHPLKGFLVLWNTMQLVRPSLVLEAPEEIVCFQFAPAANDGSCSIAAGLSTGQVAFWHLDSIASAAAASQREGASEAESTIKPSLITALEYSHRGSVSCLRWIANDAQVDSRSEQIADEHQAAPGDKSTQLISFSADGFAHVWDLRFQEIAEGLLPWVAKPRIMPVQKGGSAILSGAIQAIFAPILRAQLKRPDGIGDLSVRSVCFDLGTANRRQLRTRFLAGSDEGDLFIADLVPRTPPAGAAPTRSTADDDEGHSDGQDLLRWISRLHASAIRGVSRSPQLPDVALCTFDTHVSLVKSPARATTVASLGPWSMMSLVGSIPALGGTICCAEWSPRRAGVIAVGCSDGSVQLWDLIADQHQPAQVCKVSHVPIRSLAFAWRGSLGRGILAAGDSLGTLFLLELPDSLTTPVHNEAEILAAVLSREEQRQDGMSAAGASSAAASVAVAETTGAPLRAIPISVGDELDELELLDSLGVSALSFEELQQQYSALCAQLNI